MMTMLTVAPHPLLELAAFVTDFPRPLGECPSPPELLAGLRLEFAAPLQSDDTVRAAVRDLLRHGGIFKPTGRSKPASEYLIKAASDGMEGINVAVDACNVASLHSGLPISVVDLDRCRAPLRVDVPPTGSSYVFNRSGQEIDVAGLLCLHDADGPCANAVKDAQRTKTSAATVRALAIVWGTEAPVPGHAAATAHWLRELLTRWGASVVAVAVRAR